MAWLSSYNYRKNITINGTPDGPQSNYRKQLIVNRTYPINLTLLNARSSKAFTIPGGSNWAEYGFGDTIPSDTKVALVMVHSTTYGDLDFKARSTDSIYITTTYGCDPEYFDGSYFVMVPVASKKCWIKNLGSSGSFDIYVVGYIEDTGIGNTFFEMFDEDHQVITSGIATDWTNVDISSLKQENGDKAIKGAYIAIDCATDQDIYFREGGSSEAGVLWEADVYDPGTHLLGFIPVNSSGVFQYKTSGGNAINVYVLGLIESCPAAQSDKMAFHCNADTVETMLADSTWHTYTPDWLGAKAYYVTGIRSPNALNTFKTRPYGSTSMAQNWVKHNSCGGMPILTKAGTDSKVDYWSNAYADGYVWLCAMTFYPVSYEAAGNHCLIDTDKCRTDFGDIRFTKSDGESKLYYHQEIYYEIYTGGEETRFQIKFDSIPAGGEIFRPNAAGDETAIGTQYPATGSHYDKVDEGVPDDASTYVQAAVSSEQRDLYNLPAHTASGTISSVTLYARLYVVVGGFSTQYLSLKTHGTVYDYAVSAGGGIWDTHTKELTTNPYTGEAWTWDEIDALQIGCKLHSHTTGYYARCSQVYALVTCPNSANFYFYYGNSEANSESSFYNSCLFGDDFELGNLSRWTTVGALWAAQGTTKYEGSYAAKGTGQADGGDARNLIKDITLTGKFKIVVAERVTHDDSDVFYHVLTQGGSSKYILNWGGGSVNGQLRYHDGAWQSFSPELPYLVNTWYLLIFTFDLPNNRYKLQMDSTETAWVTTVLSTSSITSILFASPNSNGKDNYLDYVYITPWADPEPAWGTWGSENTLYSLAGIIAGTTSISGTTKILKKLAGIIPGGTMISATITLKALKFMAGVINGIAAVSGNLKIIKKLAGTISGGTTVAGTLYSVFKLMAGVVNGATTVVAGVRLTKRLGATIASETSLGGAIRIIKRLQGIIPGATSVIGSLSTLGETLLAGIINGVTIVSGTLKLLRRLTGTANGTTAISASGRRIRRIAGVISGATTVTASFYERGRTLTIKIITTQYRILKAIIAQKRQIKTLLSGG